MSVGIRGDKMYQRGLESWMLCRPGSQNIPAMTDRGLVPGRAINSEWREARLGQTEAHPSHHSVHKCSHRPSGFSLE